MRDTRRAVWSAGLAAVALVAWGHQPAVADASPGRVVPGLAIGGTHAQFDADPWGDPIAVQRAHTVLASATEVQAQQIMGWGANNPEPSPGLYDFSTLDARVALMTSTGATPVLVLCGAPDWMKGGSPGTTDWSKVELAPSPEHYRDFAALAVTIAKRYPQVRHFVVWNELKGFWSEPLNRWDYGAYTDLYNTVFDSLKAYDPTLSVGGPHVVMDSWSQTSATSDPSEVGARWGIVDQRPLDAISYWLAHKHGADFIALDATSATRDRGVQGSPVAATAKFSAVDGWVRARTTLPIWWVEFYTPAPTLRAYSAAQAAAFVRMAKDGVAVALQWQPQADGSDCQGCLYTDTRTALGGRSTISGRMFTMLARALSEVSWTTSSLSERGSVLRIHHHGGPTIVVDERSLSVRLIH